MPVLDEIALAITLKELISQIMDLIKSIKDCVHIVTDTHGFVAAINANNYP